MNRKVCFPFILLAAASFLLMSCKDDNPTTPTQQFGSVAGTITFVGTWPTSGDIQVSIFSSWPIMGPPTVASDPITSGVATYNYKLEGLNKGNYKAIVVGWRDPANPMNARVLGIYINDPNNSGVTDNGGGQPTYATPTPIDITDAKMDLTGLNIKADFAFVP